VIAKTRSRLIENLRDVVPVAVRDRGQQYFDSGRVDLEFGNAREVLATVHGTRAYAVELARAGATIETLCTCPAFADHGVCKHVWATLLEAADAGFLEPAGEPTPSGLAATTRSWGALPTVPKGAAAKAAAAATAAAHGAEEGRLERSAGRSSAAWRRLLAVAGMWPETAAAPAADLADLFFVLDLGGDGPGPARQFRVEVLERRQGRRREGKPRRPKLSRGAIEGLPEGPLRAALLFLDAVAAPADTWRGWREDQLETRAEVPAPAAAWLLPILCSGGRCFLRDTSAALHGPLRWDDGPAWQFQVQLRRATAGHWDARAVFTRGTEKLASGEALLVIPAGVLCTATTAARLEHAGAHRWLELLRALSSIQVPAGDETDFLRVLLTAASPPQLDLPPELAIAELRVAPKPLLRVHTPSGTWGRGGIPADVVFGYDGWELPAGGNGEAVFDPSLRRRVFRDREAESAFLGRLPDLGFVTDRAALPEVGLEIPLSRFPAAVSTLISEGWRVEAEGRAVRPAEKRSLAIASGVDWFELSGGIEFAGTVVPLPELLAALRRGESFVRLGDGGVGLLPQEWLQQVAPLVGLGCETKGAELRFERSQIGLLDALLEAQPDATCDALFASVRSRLRAFDGVEEAPAPAGFQGELRAYQRQGLGWFGFLEEFGFGGCLADDMGLGKTVQVLALLESRRVRRQSEGLAPSLAVVPKSVVSNWIAEAARFTPRLRVLNQTGPERARAAADFHDYDLIVTTYGTLRRDVPLLAEIEFDYVILDEAQAVKNRESESAKAVRLLRGRHRLALTGTPVENHLGELWSLFEFLNPGMLGAATVFQRHTADLRDLDATEAALLARALRPFLLRRTKEQVAHDLPPKVEQTLLCDLSASERRRYDDLRQYYRVNLAEQVAKKGLGSSKILVLEALLRLRQAACHGGLLDPKLAHGSSAKFELLLGELHQVLAEGHKALVFSQFTSLLALLRRRLDGEGVRYAYLDGRTRDRAERVAEFQENPEIPLFLISLKAGGLGLNLTAADYVYLLDPWWNPAVEAQAVDRSHRIGQIRPVFAYRLVARDTVEERILELQQRKRQLANAILQADRGMLQGLSREDLDLLLS
jgi:superfamily II DNA or RNA helicase